MRILASLYFDHKYYKQVVMDSIVSGARSVSANTIQYNQKLGRITTVSMTRKPITAIDVKRYYVDGIKSYGYGHPETYSLGYTDGDIIAIRGGYILGTERHFKLPKYCKYAPEANPLQPERREVNAPSNHIGHQYDLDHVVEDSILATDAKAYSRVCATGGSYLNIMIELMNKTDNEIDVILGHGVHPTPGCSRADTSTPLEIDYNYSDTELAKIVFEEILSVNANSSPSSSSSSSGVAVESISPSKKMRYF